MYLSDAKNVAVATHMAALRANRRAHGHYWVSGPGVGKSDSVSQTAEIMAQKLNEPVGLVVFMLASISSVDVRGFMLPFKNGDKLDTMFSTPPWFPTKSNIRVVLPDGTWFLEGTWTADVPAVGMLFLDEFGQADDDVKKPTAELIYKGNVGGCYLPQGWRVIAAGNRMKDRSGVMRELMFIVNRQCRLEIDAHLPTWLDWANTRKPDDAPHYLTISFAQKNPGIVFQETVPDDSKPFCTPRTLCLMDNDLRSLRTPEQIATDRLPGLSGDQRADVVAHELAAGWIGAGATAQFYTHLRYADELPEIADIERNPFSAKLPEHRDAQMVCGYFLAHNVNNANAGKVLQYVERLQIEMQVLAVGAMTNNETRRLAVQDNEGFGTWLLKNKDLLVAARA